MGRLARNPDVECTELADGAVLLNMETRLYYSLNQTGLELWNATDGANGPEQVAKRLTEAFESWPSRQSRLSPRPRVLTDRGGPSSSRS